MKKRTLIALLLLAAWLLQLSACIALPSEPPAAEPEPPSREESSFEESSGEEPPAPVLPEWLTPEIAANEFLLLPPQDAIVDASSAEYSYRELEEDLAALAARYPGVFSYRSFGQSLDGRELYVGILGDADAPRQLLVCAGIHGREYLTPLLAMMQTEFLLYYLEVGSCRDISYTALLESTCVYIVPMANPDGIMLSQEGIESLSSPALKQTVRAIYESDKSAGLTSQEQIDDYLLYWKANAAGVDLNRNFDALWEEYRPKIYQPSFAQYKGPSPASEPETRALTELTESLTNPVAVISLHSQGEVLYWYCGQTDALLEQNGALAEAIGDRTGYELMNELHNDASFTDWCTLEKGIPSVTVETGLGICPLSISKYPKIWNDQYDLIPLCIILLTDENAAPEQASDRTE